jgi:hypothetical protein
MKRRQLLAGCGALLTGAGTGCVGLFDATTRQSGEATPDPAATDAGSTPPPTPSHSPTPTPTPVAPPDRSPTPTSDGTPASIPTPDPTSAAEDSVTARREALTAYRAGDARLDAYDRDTQVARIGFERAKYGGAAARYRDAVEEAEQAATYFDWAAGWATLADRPAARGVAASAAAYTRRYLREFASRGVAASEAARAGRLDEARDHVAAMHSTARAARSAATSLVTPPAFERRVGL